MTKSEATVLRASKCVLCAQESFPHIYIVRGKIGTLVPSGWRLKNWCLMNHHIGDDDDEEDKKG